MNSETRRHLEILVARLRAEADELERVISAEEPKESFYYPYMLPFRFPGFIWLLICVAVIAVLFTLCSVPAETP